jgi:predicted aldo/keto reductase-like oxidoreductase
MKLSRRQFLETTAAGALATNATASTALPTRTLGKTGVKVTALAMGAGSRFLMYKEEDEALAAVKKALDLGITYIDSADDYGKDHLSERRVGKAIQGRRKGLFLATKVSVRDGDAAARAMEESLKAFNVDQIDLIHIHSLTTAEDLAAIEAKGAVLDRLLKARDQKMTRFIGITSHTDPSVLKTALERHDFDCTQMALNGALVGMTNGGRGKGMVPNPEIKTSFETLALPVAVRKKMGVIAMKVFAQDALLPKATPEQLIGYSLSLPVTAVVVGMPKMEQIDDNVRIVKAFRPMDPAEKKRLSNNLSATYKAQLDEFFRTHVDA